MRIPVLESDDLSRAHRRRFAERPVRPPCPQIIVQERFCCKDFGFQAGTQWEGGAT